MLDQNTDRMWYVIGAIIIGGLILTSSIVLFTDVAFAGVGDAFDGMVSLTTLDDEPYNIIEEVGFEKGLWVNESTGKLSSASNGENHAVTNKMKVAEGRSYEFIMPKDVITNLRVVYFDRDGNYIEGSRVHGHYSATTAPKGSHYALASARFRKGNGYNNPAVDPTEWYFGWLIDE